jgi:hypothetical protein
MGAAVTYSSSMVDCAAEDNLRADQQTREDLKKWHIPEVLFQSIPQSSKSASEKPTRSSEKRSRIPNPKLECVFEIPEDLLNGSPM